MNIKAKQYYDKIYESNFFPSTPLTPTLTQYSAAFEVPAPISTFARSHNVPSKRLGMPFVKCVESVDAIRPTQLNLLF